MTAVAQAPPARFRTLDRLWAFLRQELRPYPGRGQTVARMVLAATLVMIICMTFRLPYAFQGAINALLISRENLRATFGSAAAMLALTAIGAIYLLGSAWLVLGAPPLHFFWVIGSFFIAFFVLGTAVNYGAAVTFVIMIAVGVPLLDRHVSAETNVEDTLRLLLASSLGAIVPAVLEWVFARFRPGDETVRAMTDRLTAVERVLQAYADDGPTATAVKTIVGFSLRGTSTLRRVLRRSGYSPQYRARMSGVVALVARLVDITANFAQLGFKLAEADRSELRSLALAVAAIRTDLTNGRTPAPPRLNAGGPPSHGAPFVPEMKTIVGLIPQAFADARSMEASYLPLTDEEPRIRHFAADALTNPDHVKFALKGCLAATICYFIYNAIDWPDISTAVTTCLLTALSTVGSSHQKQVLRIGGALIGGVIGMGSQIFVLPYLDSIVGFTALFALVISLAAWIMTSTPRLSYFGLQVAVAFCFINLSAFAIETSLASARDRVVGILLGLVVMWLVFDQLGGAPSAVAMKRASAENLRLLAQLAREPLSQNLKAAMARFLSLREMISNSFDQVRALADGVVLEFDPAREMNLALRSRITRAQPELRMLFLTLLATSKYRMRLPGFELPEPVIIAQREFDDHLAAGLELAVDRVEGRSSASPPSLQPPLAALERTVEIYDSQASAEPPAARFQAFLALHRRLERLTTSLSAAM
jgi:multidrug resistance protein MdtO